MRILFLHQNFPGQWIHVARHFASQPGHRVVAVTNSTNKAPQFVETHRYQIEQAPLAHLPIPILRFGASYMRGRAAAMTMLSLRQSGFVPDVVAGHAGWGETLLVKEVWPETKLLIYGEFYYKACGLDVNFDPEFPRDESEAMSVAANNATMMMAAASADEILTPTQWQRSTFPAWLQDRVIVAHDGIDTRRIMPNPTATLTLGRDNVRITAEDEVITFVSRNLEPYRGYHTFMRSLPTVMKRLPKARVIIIGGDKVSYGDQAPPGQSWKTIYLDEVRSRIDINRIHFVGHVPHTLLWEVFALSTCHIYLTYPFVLSWSLLEAMAVGCVIVGSDTPPVQEVIRDGKNGMLVNFFDHQALADRICEAVQRRRELDPMRAAARQTVVDEYDLTTKCLPRLADLIESLSR